MKFTKLNILLLAVMLICILINWTASRDFTRRNWIVMPEMLKSVPYDSWSPNPNFANGKTLQIPVAGTIARGIMPLHFEATEADAVRAGKELINPYAQTDTAAIERGRLVFKSFCMHCHGTTGAGDGMVAVRGFPPPPSLTAENAMSLPQGRMFHIITYGQGNMPSHSALVSPDDRWKVILYIVSSIQRRQ